MNCIFGNTALSGSGNSRHERAQRHVTDRYGQGTTQFQFERPHTTLGVRKSPGKAMGTAHRGGRFLALLGFVHLPLPGWSGGQPVDDPDGVAAYLLERFEREQLGFLDNVYGHFSVVLVDEDAGRILLATDPYGVRKIFFHSTTELSFSTNLLTLGHALGRECHPDRAMEDFFLVHGFHPFDRTAYAGVHRTTPGKIYEWNDGALLTHPVKTGDPWAEQNQALDFSKASEEEIAKALYEAFMRAMEEEVTSDERTAVLLGGFDSALVASALKRMGKHVETYSFFYDDPRYDQPHTDTVERFLDIKHHWIPIDGDTIREGLETYGLIFNEPTCWPNYVIQTEKLCQVIRDDGFEHCYSGDGCDSVFFGYPLTYKRLKVVQAIDAIPQPLAKAAIAGVGMLGLEQLVGRPYHVALGLLRGRSLSEAERQMLSLRIFDESTLPRLRNGSTPSQDMTVAEAVAKLAAPHAGEHPVRLAYAGKNLISPTKTKLTGSTDKTGLLINSPFMHIGIKHFTARLPETLIRAEEGGKDAGVIGKYILTKMAEQEKLLPHEVIHQKKVGAVDAPVAEWYARECHGTMMRLMERAPFEADPDYLANLMREKPVEAGYGKLIGRHTNNAASMMLGPSLLATLGALQPQ